MSPVDKSRVKEDPRSRMLTLFTERAAVRRLARTKFGEMLLADHEGEIVDPAIDPKVFSAFPEDLSSENYAHTTLLMAGDAYLPGILVVGAALRYHIKTRASLVCLVDDMVSSEARDMIGLIYDRVVEVPRLRAHESSYPKELLSEAYRDVYTKLYLFDSALFPYKKVTFVDADLLPVRFFDHLFAIPTPAGVIESVHPTSQYEYIRHMDGVRHGQPVPPAILSVESDSDIYGGVNAGLLVISPNRSRFEDMVARIKLPMSEWGPKHRAMYDAGIRYGFPEQHFLQVDMQEAWYALDPRYNSMRMDVLRSFGIHWTIGRKPWFNHGNPGATMSQALWILTWETLRVYHPEICANLEERGLVRDRP